jgi:hypothetical protein
MVTGLGGLTYAQEVRSDRIVLHDFEYIPRFTDLPKVLIVPAGQTVTLPADSTWDAIEVAGTLKVSRTFDTVCRFIHLTVLPGGTLDAGTATDPVLTHVEFVIRDIPINTEKDPYQWGNGIINLGRQYRVGRRVAQPWAELTEDVDAGAASLHLAVPEGWRVGDELLLPDTRQIGRGARIRRESKVTIASIDGNTITLSKPVDFEHRSVLDPEGGLVLRPRVANLTRNIVIRSENPLGVRGHTVNTGSATWDIRYNQLIGLGRTRAENLNSTEADPATGKILQIGTNQIARYASHDHHVHGHGGSHAGHAPIGYFIGNVLDGTGVGKWGHVVHGTHDTDVEENVAVDFVGSGFVTEDGYEVRNVFRRNVAAYCKGNGMSAPGNVNLRQGRNCPGCEGAGFWFRGLKETIENNEAWNNTIGINLFSQSQVKGQKVPSVPGGEPDTVFEPRTTPVSVVGNVTLSNGQTGLEYWNTLRFPVSHHITANNGSAQMLAGQSNIHLYLLNATLIAQGGTTLCVSSSEAYVFSLEFDGGVWAGCDRGLHRGGARSQTRLRNLVMQNRIDLDLPDSKPDELIIENVLFKPLGSFPKQYIVLGKGLNVTTTTSDFRAFQQQRGSRIKAINWQGSGQDYLVFERAQLASKPAWLAVADNACRWCTPEPMTMGESWAKYGIALRGSAVADADAVELDGLVDGVARRGLTDPLGVPRAVLTLPNAMRPAVVNGARIKLHIVLTGDYTQANDVAVVQIDDMKPVRSTGDRQGDHRTLDTTAIAPGTHAVKTWREDTRGRKIPESELAFQYVVGAVPENESSRAPAPERSGMRAQRRARAYASQQ